MKNTDERPDDTVQIAVIARRDQRDLLKAKARAANMTTAKFVQKLIADSVVISKPDLSADMQKLNAWLGRLNSNLNMLAKWANVYQEKAFADVILLRLATIQKELSEVVEFSSDLRAQGYGKRRRTKKVDA